MVESLGMLYDQQTVEVMRLVLENNSNCVDVGCHKGEILDEVIKLAPEGLHFAFEPLPDLYTKLVDKYVKNPNIKIRGSALSDTAGNATFQHVITNPAYSGLKKRRYDRPNEIVEEILVNTEKLDEVIPRDIKISFIKIDVEGGEYKVLLGARETILTSRPVIVFEHGLGGSDHYGIGPELIYELLVEDLGMEVFLMEEWLGFEAKYLTKERLAYEFYSGNNYYFMALYRS